MIKNLILDFGDVLINLDKEAVPKAIEKKGFSSEDPVLQTLSRTYEKGLMPTEDFLTEASKYLGMPDRAELISIWNRTILDFPPRRLSFLEDLKSDGRFRLFLLSNTNELHMDHVKDSMGEAMFTRFERCFEGFYLSYLLGLRKPEPAIFRHVMHEHGLEADQTLFVDDTQEHVVSAASLGMRTWNLQPGSEDVADLLDRI